MLKILIAPSALKGTMSPVAVAEAIQSGINSSGIDCQLDLAPLADGGDGTLECLHYALGGNFEQVDCQGPTGKMHTASWLQLPDCAVVELAASCGLALIKDQKLEPLTAHTLGLGKVIADCLKKGQKEIVVTLGGSASTDGGTGALNALGAHFFDANKIELGLGGAELCRLDSVDLSLLKQISVSLKVAVDVNNPLLGAQGAASVFAAQKGAAADDIEKLELGLSRLADVLEDATGKKFRSVPGSGAAGGVAFGLAVGLDAQLISGFHWLYGLLDLERKIQWADLIISAEGKVDAQSLSGKASGELGHLCKKLDKNLIVIAASVEKSCDWMNRGIREVVTIAFQGKLATAADIKDTAAKIALAYRK